MWQTLLFLLYSIEITMCYITTQSRADSNMSRNYIHFKETFKSYTDSGVRTHDARTQPGHEERPNRRTKVGNLTL